MRKTLPPNRAAAAACPHPPPSPKYVMVLVASLSSGKFVMIEDIGRVRFEMVSGEEVLAHAQSACART